MVSQRDMVRGNFVPESWVEPAGASGKHPDYLWGMVGIYSSGIVVG